MELQLLMINQQPPPYLFPLGLINHRAPSGVLTLQYRHCSPYVYWTLAAKLPDGALQEVERNSRHHQHHKVRDDEGTCAENHRSSCATATAKDECWWLLGRQLTSSVLVGQVREPPDVSQADSVADGGEDVLLLVGPVSSLGVLVAIIHVRVLLSMKCFQTY